MSQTETQTIQSAKKPHPCSWCAQKIYETESYKRYRWFDGGDATTCKLHLDCYDAMQLVVEKEGRIEFTPGDNPKGCSCGFDPECECQQ